MTDRPWPELVDELIAAAPPAPLDAGPPVTALQARLEEISLEEIVPGARDTEAAQCCLSGLWLRAGDLQTSHRLSQDIGSSEGSFWHGIMHRREGDFSNAKYWFRRVGEHPIYQELGEALGQVDETDRWDPHAFVDRVAKALRQGGEIEKVCQLLQEIEWHLLFRHCYRKAIGG